MNGDYKITQSQTQQGELVDKWYIKPNRAFLCCDKDVMSYFDITWDEFYKVIENFGGTRHHYRSWFPTKDAAIEAAELMTAEALMRRMVA